ncbi:preprotein translocase subunit SecG [Adhaeribacter radiodurans]|uniref:Protein-export membrane protein SecG n=1 Tax=Adhaeribacter radiodurans TaxID=2745197 RepID=A0A7L7L637_9BACT|nr:preprotein translocase subunit SecG [Adhaeribacter radiodurans]QMU28278.1 preprotein translocase subunit SecG [Adhaeribacter radiodurans]
MYIALICIIIFVCVLLILVVLSQNSKGGGLSSQFGAGSSQLMGVKRTGDLLEKLTWGFAIALVLLTLTSHVILDENSSAVESRSVNVEKASQERAAPAAAPVIPPAGTKTPAGTTTPAQQPAVSTPGVTTDTTK